MAEVTETELAILEAVWSCGPSTIREIVLVVYQEHTPSLHATVKSLLERLESKGYVQCDKGEFAHKFSARVSREAYVGRQLTQLAESHFGGQLGPMLLTLVEKSKLNKKDREAIRKMIEGME